MLGLVAAPLVPLPRSDRGALASGRPERAVELQKLSDELTARINVAVDLHRGDMVAFTARTLHRVTRVETGERLVLLSFADWHR